MHRRHFIQAGMLAGTPPLAAQVRLRNLDRSPEVTIEKAREGAPHRGKVLAAVQPHSDDIALFASGTVIKLLREGYTGILIRTTNDEMKGSGSTTGEVIRANEKDTEEAARRMGIERAFHLNYRSHRLDDASVVEMRARLIFLFRLLRVDTVVCDDPWTLYEENPDHHLTAKVVESACWMAGGEFDFPEHFAAGLQPHAVSERYYYGRGPQLVNRIVDIGPVMDQKVDVNMANVSLGPAGNSGAHLRARLASEGRKLPLLGNDDDTANREYIKHIVLREDAEVGRRHDLEFAEPFHYIGPKESMLDDYIEQNAVSL